MEKFDEYDVILSCGGKCGGSTLDKTFNKNGYNTIKIFNNNILDKLIEIEKKNKVYVFDSYRPPIERHISAFFQHIMEVYVFKPLDKININMLIYWYNKYYIDCDNYHPLDSMIHIFDNYKFDFNKEYIKKITHLENKEIIYIKLRFKSIHIWDKILSDIMEKNIIIYPDNISENKEYARLYKEFKNNYLVPVEYLNQIQLYDTFIRYNSLLEKEEYIKEWKKKSMETNLFLEKITDSMFENIPENFNPQIYIQKNSLDYDNDLDAKIHYEFVGFYKNLWTPPDSLDTLTVETPPDSLETPPELSETLTELSETPPDPLDTPPADSSETLTDPLDTPPELSKTLTDPLDTPSADSSETPPDPLDTPPELSETLTDPLDTPPADSLEQTHQILLQTNQILLKTHQILLQTHQILLQTHQNRPIRDSYRPIRTDPSETLTDSSEQTHQILLQTNQILLQTNQILLQF
jgi:hypothetical protein